MAHVAIPLTRVLEATGGVALHGQSGEEFTAVTIDSRAVAAGALFVAVKGDRFDGHDFAAAAVAAGARGVVVARGRGKALPDVAVVVSIAGVHLEQLGTIENVARAKAEIFAGLGADGIAIYQATESLLVPYVVKLAHKLTFGPKLASPTVAYDDVVPGPK